MGSTHFSAKHLVKAKGKIILPVDVSTFSEAEHLIKTLGPHVGIIKIGLETMTAIGAPVIAQLAAQYGVPIFYDGKFNDIPNTIGKSTAALLQYEGITMMNVHAGSGNESILAAVKNRGNMDVLVVTVLTSITSEECTDIFGCIPEVAVLKLAHKALRCGAQGIICSPQELLKLRQYPELKSLMKVTPGIQPEWMQKNDQARVMTPYEATIVGADYLVIGRAITAPPQDHEYIQGDPLKAVRLITEEIATAIAEKEMAKA